MRKEGLTSNEQQWLPLAGFLSTNDKSDCLRKWDDEETTVLLRVPESLTLVTILISHSIATAPCIACGGAELPASVHAVLEYAEGTTSDSNGQPSGSRPELDSLTTSRKC